MVLHNQIICSHPDTAVHSSAGKYGFTGHANELHDGALKRKRNRIRPIKGEICNSNELIFRSSYVMLVKVSPEVTPGPVSFGRGGPQCGAVGRDLAVLAASAGVVAAEVQQEVVQAQLAVGILA